MASPLHSSLLYNPHIREEPYLTWLNFSTTAEDYLELATTLSGIPKPWIEWVENQVNRRLERGIVIKKPLSYRLAILWNGIILLQETKFICDVLENAYRQGFYSHCSKLKLKFSDLESSIPSYKQVAWQYMKEENVKIDNEALVSAEFLSCFTFYQLTETMVRNWKKIFIGKGNREGFVTLFWKDVCCRDSKLFSKDMRCIRQVRNKIAHSKTLFYVGETQKIYQLACKWLPPLSVELKTRVIGYRRERPRFLENLRLA